MNVYVKGVKRVITCYWVNRISEGLVKGILSSQLNKQSGNLGGLVIRVDNK